MLVDVDRYIRRELLSYMILGKLLDDWSQEFYNKYLKQNGYAFKVVIIHINHPDLNESDLRGVFQKLETDFPELSCRVIREEIVGIVLDKKKDASDYCKILSPAIGSYIKKYPEKNLVNCWVSEAAGTVQALTGQYKKLRDQNKSEGNASRLRSKLVLEIFSLEHDLYDQMLRCDWDNVKLTLTSIGERTDTINGDNTIQTRAYFGYLWRYLDRHIFQMTGKRKTIPEKDHIDNKLKNVAEVSDMVALMFDFAMQYADELKLNRQKSTHKAIENVKEYVEHRYSEDISLENAASYVGLSSFHLSKIFKKAEGINFKEYVIGVRIRHAKLLLGEGRLNIGEIAQQVGYPNANYFSRAFKESCGVSPTEFSGRLRKAQLSSDLPEPDMNNPGNSNMSH